MVKCLNEGKIVILIQFSGKMKDIQNILTFTHLRILALIQYQ